MATKESKAIKQLKKQVKKLNARIDEMSREIKGLHDTVDTTASKQMAAESQEEFVQGSRFSQDEVEIADELTEDAEEVADIREKNKERK